MKREGIFTMKKHRNQLLLVFSFMLLLTGCSNQTGNVKLSNTKQLEVLSYQESDLLSKNLQIENFNLDNNTDGTIGTFCIYDDTIFYNVDYINYYDNPTGEKAKRAFKKEHNTQIYSYDIKNKKHTLIYQYDAKRCIQITDMQCNGSQLVWEDDSNEAGWNIKKIDLVNSMTPKNIISADKKNGNTDAPTVTITKDCLYWYEQTNEVDKFFNLCSYDFKTETKHIEKKGLTLSSPYKVHIVNNVCTTYETKDEKESVIHISPLQSKKAFDIYVDEPITDPISNGEICVWMNGYDNGYQDRGCLFIYDISEKTMEKISTPSMFSYGMINDFILVNQKDGLYLYDTKNKTYKRFLKETEDISYGYTFQGQENNIYIEKFGEELQVLNISFEDN